MADAPLDPLLLASIEDMGSPVEYTEADLVALFGGNHDAVQTVLTLQNGHGIQFGGSFKNPHIVAPSWLGSQAETVAQSFTVSCIRVLSDTAGKPLPEPTYLFFTASKPVPHVGKVDAIAAMSATSNMQLNTKAAVRTLHPDAEVVSLDVVAYGHFAFNVGTLSPGDRFHEAGEEHDQTFLIGLTDVVGFSSHQVANWVINNFPQNHPARAKIHGFENGSEAAAAISEHISDSTTDGVPKALEA